MRHWEASSSSSSQILNILWNPLIYLGSTCSEPDKSNQQTIFLTQILILSSCLAQVFQSVPFFRVSPPKFCMHFCSHARHFPTHSTLLDWITPMIFKEEHKSPTLQIRQFPTVACCILGISLNTLFSKFRAHMTQQTSVYTTPVCFTPVGFNAHCQFTPLLNLQYIIVGLRPFCSLRSITLTTHFWWEYPFSIYAHFSSKATGT